MTRNTHDRLNDHFGEDLDTNIVVDGDVGDGSIIPDGTGLHDALGLILDEVAAGGGGGGLLPGGGGLISPQMGLLGTIGTLTLNGNRRAFPVLVPGNCRLRSLWVEVSTANATGVVEWGLFDPRDDHTAATKIAGGSGTLSSTGWFSLPATGEPITVDGGTYILIIKGPAANQPAIRAVTYPNAAPPWNQNDANAWDDTPDLGTGWSRTTVQPIAVINADMRIATNSRWF